MAKGQISSEDIEVLISYSHIDEPLRNELEKHLSILKRQKLISTWHDRKIGAGEEWKEQIDDHLNSAQIILLLISADFLASDYCYNIEIKRAMERHESGEARVIPIILRPVDWKGAPFGKLQALPTNAEPIVSKKWGCTDEAFVDVARGLRATVGSLNPVINTNQKTKQIIKRSSEIIVDQMHRGDYATINDAISAAAPGSRILVRPGVYDEGLVIDKALEIEGDGKLGEVLIRAEGKNAIFFRTARGIISNLVLKQIGGGDFYCVAIQQGVLELNRCDITSDSSACVAIYGKAYPKLRGNKIHDGKKSGIFVYENGQGLIEDNDIFGLAFSGIEIEEAGNPTVRGNKIRDGKQNGILVYKNGQGLIEDNDIFENAFSGIEIREAGNPTVRRNCINRNVNNAVYVHDKGAGIIENNDLRDNKKGAWFISDDCINLAKRSGNQE
jgi:parallel beta-helix repeat protein